MKVNPIEIIVINFTQTLDDDQTGDDQYMSNKKNQWSVSPIGWSFGRGRLAAWWVGESVGWSVGGHSIGCSVGGHSIGWSVGGQSVGWSVGGPSVGWLLGLSGGWSVDRLRGE